MEAARTIMTESEDATAKPTAEAVPVPPKAADDAGRVTPKANDEVARVSAGPLTKTLRKMRR